MKIKKESRHWKLYASTYRWSSSIPRRTNAINYSLRVFIAIIVRLVKATMFAMKTIIFILFGKKPEEFTIEYSVRFVPYRMLEIKGKNIYPAHITAFIVIGYLCYQYPNIALDVIKASVGAGIFFAFSGAVGYLFGHLLDWLSVEIEKIKQKYFIFEIVNVEKCQN